LILRSSSDSREFVLDAFAVVAYFRGEPGLDRVQRLLDSASAGGARLHMSAVNHGEALYSLYFRQGPEAPARAMAAMETWRMNVISVDRDFALAAARIKAARRLGYLDCFATALAQRLTATLVTGDPDFRRVADLVQIEWLPA
jgi:predicted nucleic acid-binding protein